MSFLDVYSFLGSAIFTCPGLCNFLPQNRVMIFDFHFLNFAAEAESQGDGRDFLGRTSLPG